MTERIEKIMSWVLLAIGVVGFMVSFPLWLSNRISDRNMLGLSLVLSWAALWYAAFVAIQESRHARHARQREGS